MHKEHEFVELEDKTSLGFWIYLMTDCFLFATLFATFAVLRHNSYDGVRLESLIHPGYVLTQTIVLLISSFTCSRLIASTATKSLRGLYMWLLATILLGGTFLAMEFVEFRQLIVEGHSWTSSAALSSFFTLVGTHGLHITIGIIWAIVMLWLAMSRGLSAHVQRRLRLFGMYWHFLDVVWVCIFTVAYLRGMMS